MSATPMIEKLLALPINSYVANGVVLNVGEIDTLRTELRALIAERDALKPAPMERRLREVKLTCFITVSGDDETVDALTALRAAPYEPVETVEDVLRKHVSGLRMLVGERIPYDERIAQLAANVRAAVRAETPNAGAGR